MNCEWSAFTAVILRTTLLVEYKGLENGLVKLHTPQATETHKMF
jgi:hypothetical protein